MNSSVLRLPLVNHAPELCTGTSLLNPVPTPASAVVSVHVRPIQVVWCYHLQALGRTRRGNYESGASRTTSKSRPVWVLTSSCLSLPSPHTGKSTRAFLIPPLREVCVPFWTCLVLSVYPRDTHGQIPSWPGSGCLSPSAPAGGSVGSPSFCIFDALLSPTLHLLCYLPMRYLSSSRWGEWGLGW